MGLITRHPGRWLADKSALARLALSPDEAEWSERGRRGLICVAIATVLEVGYSARSGSEWEDVVKAPPFSDLPWVYLTPAAEDRAVAVQGMLAQRGQYRAPSVSDLLIAAIAELMGFVVLHDDKDFDLIAEVTDQPVERLRY